MNDVFIQIRMVGSIEIVDQLTSLFKDREDITWDVTLRRFAVLNPIFERNAINYIIAIIPKVKEIMQSDFELETVFYDGNTLKRLLHTEVGEFCERCFLLPFYTPKQSYLIL